MLFEKLHHVAIIVSDYQRAREFYVEKLGFPVLRENIREERGDRKLDLQFGDGELEIFFIPGAPPRPSYPEAQGLRHLAFRVAYTLSWTRILSHKTTASFHGEAEKIS